MQANLKFRQELHSQLAIDKEAQKVFLEIAYQYVPILFDLCWWTYNPKKKAQFRNSPFILRPIQIEVVNEVVEAIREGHDILIDKSREEGATEIVSKIFASEFLLVPQTSLLVGSRKEEYVDASCALVQNRVVGSSKCVFHKILYTLATCPLWMRPNLIKTHMHLEDLDNGSIIDGEATNPSFGAGDRRTAVMLDEFGRVEPGLAQDIRDSIADVTDCVIYNSTHFYGAGHPFAKLRRSGKVKVVILPWWSNPEKNKGLYKSPEIGKVEIIDKDYYIKPVSEYSIFNNIRDIPDNQCGKAFVAEGTNKYRSGWYDKENKRRDPRDVAQNLDMNAIGSGDIFFDTTVLLQLREKIRPSLYKGDIEFALNNKGQILNSTFAISRGRQDFKWWGELIYGRPDQSHNYIVACDISMGTGASNSIAGVYDVNTKEKIGILATSRLAPEEFCDTAIALCYWVGGMSHKPYLIWEANGPGNAFDKRRRFHKYYFCYFNTQERRRSRHRTQQPGWYSTRTSKYDALLDLRVAISEGLKHNKPVKSLTIYDEETLNEYEAYVFGADGQIGLSTSEDDSTGARLAHGDRVIADAMAIIALGDQPKAVAKERAKVMPGTAAHRRQLYKEAIKEENSPFKL